MIWRHLSAVWAISLVLVISLGGMNPVTGMLGWSATVLFRSNEQGKQFCSTVRGLTAQSLQLVKIGALCEDYRDGKTIEML